MRSVLTTPRHISQAHEPQMLGQIQSPGSWKGAPSCLKRYMLGSKFGRLMQRKLPSCWENGEARRGNQSGRRQKQLSWNTTPPNSSSKQRSSVPMSLMTGEQTVPCSRIGFLSLKIELRSFTPERYYVGTWGSTGEGHLNYIMVAWKGAVAGLNKERL